MSSLLALSIRGVRAFDSKSEQTIEFKKPLTVILGPNGCGKTTVIECLRFATTGQLPPGSMSGKAFVHDCKVEETTEVKASIKLLFEISPGGNRYMSLRNMQLTQKKKTSTFKQIDGVLRHIPMEGGVRGRTRETTQKCAQLSTMVPGLLRISRAVLDNVIFCHQEDSCWPLSQGSELKKRFDAIFESTRYTKALEAIIKERKQQVANSKEIKAELDVKTVHLRAFQKLEEDRNEIEERINRMNDKAEGQADRIREALKELQVAQYKTQEAKQRAKEIDRLRTQLEYKREEHERVNDDITEEMENSLEELEVAKGNWIAQEGERKKKLSMLKDDFARKQNNIKAVRQKLQSLATTRGEYQGAVMRTVAHARSHTVMRNRYVSDLELAVPGGSANKQIEFDSMNSSSTSNSTTATNMELAVSDSTTILREIKLLQERRLKELSSQQERGRSVYAELQQGVSDVRGKVGVLTSQIQTSKDEKSSLDSERRSLKDSLRNYPLSAEASSRKTQRLEQSCLDAQNRLKDFESKKKIESLRQSKNDFRAWDVRLKNKEEQVKDKLRLLLKNQSTVEQLSAEKSNLSSELALLKENNTNIANEFSDTGFGRISGLMGNSIDHNIQAIDSESTSVDSSTAATVSAVTEFAKTVADEISMKETGIEREYAHSEKSFRTKVKTFNLAEAMWSEKKDAYFRVNQECKAMEQRLENCFKQLKLDAFLPETGAGSNDGIEESSTKFTDEVMETASKEMKDRLSSVQENLNMYENFDKLCDTAIKLVARKHKCMLCERGFNCYADDIDEAGYIAQVKKLQEQSREKSKTKDVQGDTEVAQKELSEFNKVKDNVFQPLRLKVKQLANLERELETFAQKRETAKGDHDLAKEALDELKQKHDAITKLDQQGQSLLRQVKTVQTIHKKVMELQDILPSTAAPPVVANIDDNNDDSDDVAVPSSLPSLSSDMRSLSEDLAKANSIESMESLEHKVGRLRADVQSGLERVDDEIDAAMKESKRLTDALQVERNKRTKHLETVREQEQLSSKLKLCESKLSKIASDIDLHNNVHRELKKELIAKETDLNAKRSEMEEIERQCVEDVDVVKNAFVSFEASHKQLEKDYRYGAAEKLATCDEEIRRVEANRNDLQVQLNAMQEPIDEVQAHINQGETFLKTISENIRSKQLEKEISDLEHQLQKRQLDYTSMNMDEHVERVKELDAKIFEMRTLQAKQGGSRSELKKRLIQCKVELSDRKYRNIEKDVRKASIAYKTVQMAAKDLDRYHGALDAALQSYHSIKVREINAIIKEIWQLCYKGGDIDSKFKVPHFLFLKFDNVLRSWIYCGIETSFH